MILQTSIAFNSAEYWKKENERWFILFEIDPIEQPMFASWWEKILGADIIGAAVSSQVEDADGSTIGSGAVVASVIAIVEDWLSDK